MGEWKQENTIRVDDLPPPPFPYMQSGFVFNKDETCEVEHGFFTRIELVNDFEQTLFLGNTTKYQIEEGKLKILQLPDSTWYERHIIKIAKDSLVLLTRDSTTQIFLRPDYSKITTLDYDKVILTYIGGLSLSAATNAVKIAISKKEGVLYCGGFKSKNEGWFTADISPTEFNKIKSRFDKANLPTLQNDYTANVTDLSTTTVTFVKDNKIVKSISDYGGQSPAEFQWAYIPLMFLHQKLALKPVSPEIKSLYPFYSIETTIHNKKYVLSPPEELNVFLLYKKYQAKGDAYKLTQSLRFMKEDTLKFKLLTDGRYYKKENESTIYDFGYNIFDRTLEDKIFFVK